MTELNNVPILANANAVALTPLVAETLGPVARRFEFEDNAGAVLSAPTADTKIITGFGPTNAPTAGTLSVMFGARELQENLGADMSVIVSELGAWNSRNVPWGELCHYRDKMISFMGAIGMQADGIEIRTHLDHANLVRTGRIARYLTMAELGQYKESLTELYESQGLLGSDVGMVVDTLYTVADVLQPAEEGFGNILMVSGYEEGYFTELARIVADKQEKSGDISLGWKQPTIGALFFKVLQGLGGYSKMSKSIPDSAINLGMNSDEIRQKILSDVPVDQVALMAAINLASDWSPEVITEADAAHREYEQSPNAWSGFKRQYLDYFLSLKEAWHEA